MSRLIELRIPHMGSVENAKIIGWLVEEGQAFKSGQPLYEVETDKTVTEVVADADGILARRDVHEGEDRKVGDKIGYTAGPDSSPDEIKGALATLNAQGGAQAIQQEPVSGALKAAPTAPRGPASAAAPQAPPSPYVRRLAAEHQVDLSAIKGTGPNGRVSADDVMSAARNRGESVDHGPEEPRPPGYENIAADVVSNSMRRRAIARRLSEAARTYAMLTADMQMDLTALFAERARLKARGEVAPSPLAYIAHAVCKDLLQHRALNASFSDTHMLLWKTVNLGIAVDTTDGLVVPVIRGADALSVTEIHTAVQALAQRARDGSLQQSELEGGTFTISNPGSLGPVLRAEAIINIPQVALLGLPAIIHTPVAIAQPDGTHSVAVRPVIRPALTFDHRALDGGQVIEFLNELKRLVES
jgi:pyruvate/2-oxoglutarate dehydrogenase complex dihydrolipoamide acyltransferase (E2) component